MQDRPEYAQSSERVFESITPLRGYDYRHVIEPFDVDTLADNGRQDDMTGDTVCMVNMGL